MDDEIRQMTQDEFPLLEDSLYEAIYVPDNFEGEVPRSIINSSPSGTVSVCLAYRSPYRFTDMLSFYRDRALKAVEVIDEKSYARAVRLEDADGHIVTGWLRVEDNPSCNRLEVTLSESLGPCKHQVASRVKRMFDVDCDPQAIARGLAPLEDVMPGSVHEGVRLPGCFDPFETACRAVLGQQISVAAAGKLAARIVERYGTPVDTGIEGATHVFPSPANILALNPIEDALGELGVVRTRSRVISEIARLLLAGELDLSGNAEAEEQIERLLACKGIGPWTANYIAMRVLSHSDAFLETDVGVARALPDLTPKQRIQVAESWRPWRSYAVLSLWNSLAE